MKGYSWIISKKPIKRGLAVGNHDKCGLADSHSDPVTS
jgi:hypothetical protein